MANLAERIGQLVTSLGVRASYGEKITIDGAEAVPVALVWFGFCGGSDDRAFLSWCWPTPVTPRRWSVALTAGQRSWRVIR